MDLAQIIKHLGEQGSRDPNLLVGFETADDAGVYKLNEELALVQTVDFITPACDDPYLFGQIAAANSLSDVYAMGGRPINALNVCCFPQEGVDDAILAQVLEGGHSKILEANATLLGGHTVKDQELKYGLSVTGVVHPEKILRNSTCKPGDKILLTKTIGTGVIITALKNDLIDPEQGTAALNSMATLNRVACEAMLQIGVHACTDISGFGLAGHLCEMAVGSKVRIDLRLQSVPVYPVSVELFGRGLRTGVTLLNKESVASCVHMEKELPREKEMVLYDPQTSGPLAISVAAEKAEDLVALLKERGVRDATIIGEVSESSVCGLFVSDSL